MAVTARYTDQIVILTTPERGAWVKAMAEEWGVSQAQVARDCIELGAERLAAAYEAGASMGVPAMKSATKSAPRKPRVSEKGHAPGRALFVSPGDEPMEPADLRSSVSTSV